MPIATRASSPSGAPIPMPAFWLVERESEDSLRLEAVTEEVLDGSGCVFENLRLAISLDALEGPVALLEKSYTCELRTNL
jgi:hypothetical protein